MSSEPYFVVATNENQLTHTTRAQGATFSLTQDRRSRPQIWLRFVLNFYTRREGSSFSIRDKVTWKSPQMSHRFVSCLARIFGLIDFLRECFHSPTCRLPDLCVTTEKSLLAHTHANSNRQHSHKFAPSGNSKIAKNRVGAWSTIHFHCQLVP